MSFFHEQFAEKAARKRVVGRTAEFQRIAGLPWRVHYECYAAALTKHFKTARGEWELRKEQAWALSEMAEVGGLIGSLEVGAGKTLITLLAAEALEASRPLLLVPASLRDKTIDEMAEYARHFRLSLRADQILSYEQLSQVNRADVLDRRLPNAIICDEAHKLKNKKAGVTRRVLRYGEQRPDTKFVFLTGSLTARSIRDYAHLAKLALKDNSPVPIRHIDLEEWADCLDVNTPEKIRPAPGALLTFCAKDDLEPNARKGYRRRFTMTKGVVSTPSPAVKIPLDITERVVVVPDRIKQVFRDFRRTWVLPEGEVCTTALEFTRHANELTNGFYNHWVWKNNQPDLEWLEARKDWKKFVRQTINESTKNKAKYPHPFDTELQVARACAKGQIDCPAQEYELWSAIRDRSSPETKPVWLSEFMVDYALEWLNKPGAAPGIVWSYNNPLIDRLRERGALCYGAGQNSITKETQSCVASLDAHGTGKNLQHFQRALYLAIPTSAVEWEQSLGRLHRPRQQADRVRIEAVFSCFETWNAFEKARQAARYIEETTAVQQKLNTANIEVRSPKEVGQLFTADDPLWTSKHAAGHVVK